MIRAGHSIVIVGPAGKDRTILARIIETALKMARDGGVAAALSAEVFDEDTNGERQPGALHPSC